jgi:hypothetical protein
VSEAHINSRGLPSRRTFLLLRLPFLFISLRAGMESCLSMQQIFIFTTNVTFDTNFWDAFSQFAWLSPPSSVSFYKLLDIPCVTMIV